MTGFVDLDEMTSGFQNGDLVIVAARPSMGKTAFTLNIAQHAAIERERDHALSGKPARIVAKLNHLVDQETIEKLYEASCAGVKIDLIVRGACMIRPGEPGLSQTIHVRSVVGRFLEHSRIFYFANGGEQEVRVQPPAATPSTPPTAPATSSSAMRR